MIRLVPRIRGRDAGKARATGRSAAEGAEGWRAGREGATAELSLARLIGVFSEILAGARRGSGPGLKFLDEAEHLPLLDPVGIEDPVEMVAFMLDDARVKPLRLSLDLPAVGIQPPVPPKPKASKDGEPAEASI